MTFSIKFEEAIKYAEGREVQLPDIFYKTGNVKSRATTVSGLASLSQIKYVIQLLNKSIANGRSIEDFKNDVKNGSIKINLPDYRLDTIFRTNIQSAYSFGRIKQQLDVIESRPYWMYDAVNDSRTRPKHKLLDNLILPATSEYWKTHYPPLGYNCRCAVISLTQTQAEQRGITQTAPDVSPDTGFGYNVYDYENSLSNLFEQTITKYEVDFNNVSKSLALLQKQVLDNKQAEFKLNSLMSHSFVSGPLKEQYISILNKTKVDGLPVHLLSDYITNKSSAIVDFLKVKSGQVVDLIISNWINTSFLSLEKAATNTTNIIYSGIPKNNKQALLTAFEDNAIVQLSAPMSFSRDISVSQLYSGVDGAMVYVDNAKNNGLDVVKAGATTIQALREKEVILLTGTKLKVNRVEYMPEGSVKIFVSITNEQSNKDY